MGATYYVSVGGNDENPGTEAMPWKTIQKAADAMVAGDTAYVKSGAYSEQVSPRNSGTAENPITYRAYGRDTVVIDGEDTRRFGILLGSARNLRHLAFEGLTLQRASQYGIFAQNASDIVFRDLVVRSNGTITGGSGLYIFACTNITVQGGAYTRNGSTAAASTRGIYVANHCTNVVISNVEASHNAHDGVAFHSSSYSQPWLNCRLVNSEVFGNRRQGIVTFRGDGLLIQGNNIYSNGATGIQLEVCTTNAFVRGNTVSSNSWNFSSETGIWADETIYSVIESNRIDGNYRAMYVSQSHYLLWRFNKAFNNRSQLSSANVHTAGVLIAGGGMHPEHPMPVGGTNNHWVHNVLYDNGVAGAQRGGWYVGARADIRSNSWVNNIVAMIAGTQEARVDAAHTISRSDHNLYYNIRPLNLHFEGRDYGWSGWRAATGWDANSITNSPRFANAAGRDFSTFSNSPAIDAGGWLTTTRSGGSGTVIPVDDPNLFSAGLGALGIAGDLVQLEGNEQRVRVIRIDRANRTITVSAPLTWTVGQGLAYAYYGARPDIGAFQFSNAAIGTVRPQSPVGFVER